MRGLEGLQGGGRHVGVERFERKIGDAGDAKSHRRKRRHLAGHSHAEPQRRADIERETRCQRPRNDNAEASTSVRSPPFSPVPSTSFQIPSPSRSRRAYQLEPDGRLIRLRGRRRLGPHHRNRRHLRQPTDLLHEFPGVLHRQPRERQARAADDADVVAGAVDEIGKRHQQAAREKQHVEVERADDGDADDRQHGAGSVTFRGAPGQLERRHRLTRAVMPRRSSIHDATAPATTPTGRATAIERSAIAGVMRMKTRVVSYRA